MYFRAVDYGLTAGVDRFSDETPRRILFYEDNKHLFPPLQLVFSFAYLEGVLGEGWIPKHGGANKRELFVLRVVRNAYVHGGGDLKKTTYWKPPKADGRKGRSVDPPRYVRSFAKDLADGKFIDRHGDLVPPYLTVSRIGYAILDRRAHRRLAHLFQRTLQDAGKLP